jgi:adenylate cyclase
MTKTAESVTRSGVLYYSHTMAILNGALRPGEAIVDELSKLLSDAERTGEDVAFGMAKANVAFALLHRDSDPHDDAMEMLAQIRDLAMRRRYSRTAVPMADIFVAKYRALHGDLDGAIELSRAVVEEEVDDNSVIFIPLATSGLVDALLQRGIDGDIEEARSAIERVAAVDVEPGLVLYDIWLQRMRALLARAQGDDATYSDCRDRYRNMAAELGFDGHMAWAEAMP